MDDFTAGHISSAEAREIVDDLGRELGGDGIEFFPGVSYRHLMVWRDGKEKMTTTPPHDITGQKIAGYLPSGEGAAAAMLAALHDGGLTPADVSYINAHATSTQAGDVAEVHAVKQIFGDGKVPVPMSSTKSMTGHLLGAAGAVETIICVLAIREGVLPPTTNYEFADPECDVDCVPNEPREADVKVAVSVADVRERTGLADFTGELTGRVALRITDRGSNALGGGGSDPATVADITLDLPVPCAATGAEAGGTCATVTTVDALIPGAVAEGRRAIWALGQVELRDPDGGVFARQGVFVR